MKIQKEDKQKTRADTSKEHIVAGLVPQYPYHVCLAETTNPHTLK